MQEKSFGGFRQYLGGILLAFSFSSFFFENFVAVRKIKVGFVEITLSFLFKKQKFSLIAGGKIVHHLFYKGKLGLFRCLLYIGRKFLL